MSGLVTCNPTVMFLLQSVIFPKHNLLCHLHCLVSTSVDKFDGGGSGGGGGQQRYEMVQEKNLLGGEAVWRSPCRRLALRRDCGSSSFLSSTSSSPDR